MPTDPTPAPADVELVARALAAEDVHWGYDHGFWVTPPTTDPETDAFARAVLRALATAGRLLPAALDGDALLKLATPLLAEALPMPPEQAVITALGRRIKAEVTRIHAAGVADGRKQAAADMRGDAHHLHQETTP